MATPLSDSTGRDRVRDHFQRAASSFDRLYEPGELVQRLVRPGLYERYEIALQVAQRYAGPRVLDIGCGSGRIGEPLLAAGASEYVGVDLSASMLELARVRLDGFGTRANLIEGDFLAVEIEGKFDVVLALGLFDYVAQPEPLVRRISALTRGSAVATFPRWSWLRGPLRHLRYEVLSDVPIYEYTDREVRFLFGAAGFDRLRLVTRRSGFLVEARRPGSRPTGL
jgi:2-polyprenyl-3-methyl-5-hydroxy-6-metoxy-1,4-benzoquinol methylase